MSFGRTAAALRIRGLSKAEQIVLVRLADHESKKGLCFPSVRGISEESGLSTRTVQYAIDSLCKKKIIYTGPYVDKYNNHRTQYFFNFEKVKEERNDDEEEGCGTQYHTGVVIGTTPRVVVGTTPGVVLSTTKSIISTDKVKSGSSSTVTTVGGGAAQNASKRKRNASKPPPGFSSVINKASGKFLRHGFEWMADLTPYKHPINEVYKDSGGNFINAWGPEDPDVIYDCDLTKEDIAAIRKSPIICALDITNEGGNKTTEKAFRNRLEWIGREHFVGEVARMYSDSKREGDHWNNPGQILIRRLDYVHAILVGTGNNTHDFNPKVLWDYALAA